MGSMMKWRKFPWALMATGLACLVLALPLVLNLCGYGVAAALFGFRERQMLYVDVQEGEGMVAWAKRAETAGKSGLSDVITPEDHILFSYDYGLILLTPNPKWSALTFLNFETIYHPDAQGFLFPWWITLLAPPFFLALWHLRKLFIRGATTNMPPPEKQV